MKTAAESSTSNNPPEATSCWLIWLAYDGTRYKGWQVQPQAPTVQGVLRERLERLYRQPVAVAGCSRTDAGVHALCQLATVRVPLQPAIPAPNIRRFLADALPDDIHICQVRRMPPDFWIRGAVLGKIYSYLFYPGPVCSPFLSRYCWINGDTLNLDAMHTAVKALPGQHDFSAFALRSRNEVERDPVKRIYYAGIDTVGPMIRFSITGNAFLYRMVRRLAGILASIGRGKLPPSALAQALATGVCPPFDTAPSQGLFLERAFLGPRAMETWRPGPILPFLQLFPPRDHDPNVFTELGGKFESIDEAKS